VSFFTLVMIVFTKRMRKLTTVVTGATRVVRFTLGAVTDRHFAFSVTVASNITFDHFKTSSFAARMIGFASLTAYNSVETQSKKYFSVF
jgi:hypothetical protein